MTARREAAGEADVCWGVCVGGWLGARKKALWDGGAPAPNSGSPRGLASSLERRLAEGAEGSLPAGCARPASPSAQLVSASFSPFLLCSLPSRGAQDSARAGVPADRGQPWSHLPLQDTIAPRFGLPRVGSGGPRPPFKVFFLCRDVSST